MLLRNFLVLRLLDRKSSLLFLSQHNYINKVLQRFNMDDSKLVSTPIAPHFKLSAAQCPSSDEDVEYMSKISCSSAVGSLIYVIVCSRLDLSYAMSLVSRYMSNPDKEHLKTVQWIFRYLRGTTNFCLKFGRTDQGLIGYVDSDYAADLDRRRSQTCYVLDCWQLCCELEGYFAACCCYVYHKNRIYGYC